ncbi:choline-phosphate cytidylyltransferase [Rhodotorula toruloides]
MASLASPGSKKRSLPHARGVLRAEGGGESSREASEESNAETGLSEDDDVDLSDARPAPASAQPITEGLKGLSLGAPVGEGVGTTAPASTRVGQLAAANEGYESAGHEGDISSVTANFSSAHAITPSASRAHVFRAPVGLHHQPSYRSSAGESGYSPSPSSSPRSQQTETETDKDDEMPPPPLAAVESRHPGLGEEPVLWAPAPSGFLSNLTAEEIQDHIRRAIAGDPGRAYKINPPPIDRPVRIYADGVYDLLHYGHMLQLRQCKLAFPSVHLLVGVCSSTLVEQHKAKPVLSSQERYESMRHVRWVDEVVEDAPWQVDQEFIDKWKIDYVAHDEEPYASAGKDDVYAYAKSIGAFLPTKRTNGISTSELLQRIVEGYREGDYDGKLRKIGHPELCSRQGSEAGTGYGAPQPLPTVGEQ